MILPVSALAGSKLVPYQSSGGGSTSSPAWTDQYDPANWVVTYNYSKTTTAAGWQTDSSSGTDKPYTLVLTEPQPTTGNPTEVHLIAPQNHTSHSHSISTSFQGTYQATLTWRWPLAQHQPPKVVYVRETSSAGSNYSNGAGSSSADNGIGSGQVLHYDEFDPSTGGCDSSGSRLTRCTVPDNGVIMLSQVSQSAAASNTGYRNDAGASGTYSAAVEPKAVEIVSSNEPTFHKGADGTPMQNYRRSDGSIDVDLATVTEQITLSHTAIENAFALTVPSTLNAIEYGIWNNPFQQWTAFGNSYSDTMFTEMTSIPVHSDHVHEDYRTAFENWLGATVTGTLGLSGTAKLSVTDNGGSGINESNTATVNIHLPVENLDKGTPTDRIGAYMVVSDSVFDRMDRDTTETVAFTASTSLAVGISVTPKFTLPSKIFEIALGFSVSETQTLTYTDTIQIPLHPGEMGLVIAAPKWKEWTVTYDCYSTHGFDSIQQCPAITPFVQSGTDRGNWDRGAWVWPIGTTMPDPNAH